MADSFSTSICERLRAVAMSLPEVAEGDSCVNRAFRVRKKAFFYLGEKPAHIYGMVKLKDSLEDAAAMEDERVSVGTIGWVTLRFQEDDPPDPATLEAWVVESYRALAPKALVKTLDG